MKWQERRSRKEDGEKLMKTEWRRKEKEKLSRISVKRKARRWKWGGQVRSRRLVSGSKKKKKYRT